MARSSRYFRDEPLVLSRNWEDKAIVPTADIILTYLLTYSMEQGPSWEASWFAAGQEIPHVLWNPKVPHRTHKRPSHVLILSQPNPVLISYSHLLKVHPNIILPSTPGSPQRSLPLGFPHQHPVNSSPFPHMGHMPRPSHSSRFYDLHNIAWWVQTFQLLIMKFSPLLVLCRCLKVVNTYNFSSFSTVSIFSPLISWQAEFTD